MTKRRSYEPLSWKDGVVRYIDQRLLPHRISYVETSRYSDLIDAMRVLAIRGAPLLGIAGAYAAVLASEQYGDDPDRFTAALESIGSARPTAVNLRSAVDRMRRIASENSDDATSRTSEMLAEAVQIHREIAAADEAIGRNGAALMPAPGNVLTICNTGPLATGGHGTAFSVIEEAWKAGSIRDVYVCETRPLLQGARLTMWEFQVAGIPATLIHDSAAGALFMERKVDAVVVGADRIAANGDTANKVGTYVLACLAEKHGVPFYVAAPTSTMDPQCPDGLHIPIEQRGGDEVTSIGDVRITPEGVRTYTPAFDITPGSLIGGIVTEKGVVRRPYAFHVSVEPSIGTGTL